MPAHRRFEAPTTAGGSIRSSATPGANRFGLKLGARAATLIGHLRIRLGARGGWLPEWAQLVAAAATALLLGPALLVALGIVIAARRYA